MGVTGVTGPKNRTVEGFFRHQQPENGGDGRGYGKEGRRAPDNPSGRPEGGQGPAPVVRFLHPG